MKANLLLLVGVIALVGFFLTLKGATPGVFVLSIGCGLVAIATLSASAAMNVAAIRQSRRS